LGTTLTYKLASTTEEFEGIHHLNYLSFVEEIPQHPPNPQRRLVDRFHEQNTYAICLDGSQLVGMIAGRCQRPFSLDSKVVNLDAQLPGHTKVVEVRLLAVAAPYRKQSVFARLAGLLARQFRIFGCDLAVISGTLRQLALYRHLGFEPFGPPVGTGESIYQPMFMTLQRFKARSQALMVKCADQPISLLPGPVELAPAVIKAFQTPALYHRDPRFTDLMARVRHMHPYRIIASSAQVGNPTPEGLHRDGVDYIVSMMVSRFNVEGGESTVTDNHRQVLWRRSLQKPMDIVIGQDALTMHAVTPVDRLDPLQEAWRDVLVIAFTRVPP